MIVPRCSMIASVNCISLTRCPMRREAFRAPGIGLWPARPRKVAADLHLLMCVKHHGRLSLGTKPDKRSRPAIVFEECGPERRCLGAWSLGGIAGQRQRSVGGADANDDGRR